jgi:D-alanyl-D-alanine carboxypeptidase (penicillin-binding protein 5/6)
VGDEIGLIGSNSSIAYLGEGNVLSFEAIVDAVLLSSGDDTTYTLAVNVAREKAKRSLSATEALAYFAELMNETANNLGCTHSHFSTVDGYPSPDHYSTAYDLLTIAIEAMNTPLICESVSQSRAYHVFLSGREAVWEATNLLLKEDSPYYYEYATGIKTGSTGEGYSLAASAEKDGVKRIAIILNAASDGGRF